MDGFTATGPNVKQPTSGQQKQFDLLLSRARQLMGSAGKEWLTALQADPTQAAVTMGVDTVRELAMTSEKAGQPVDPMVLLHVGIQFVKDIASVANEAGFVPDEQIEAFLKDVLSQSMAEYLKLDAADGLIKPGEQKQAEGLLAKMGGSQAEPGEAAEPVEAVEGPGPDETPMHEQAEGTADDPEMEAELMAIRKAKGAM